MIIMPQIFGQGRRDGMRGTISYTRHSEHGRRTIQNSPAASLDNMRNPRFYAKSRFGYSDFKQLRILSTVDKQGRQRQKRAASGWCLFLRRGSCRGGAGDAGYGPFGPAAWPGLKPSPRFGMRASGSWAGSVEPKHARSRLLHVYCSGCCRLYVVIIRTCVCYGKRGSVNGTEMDLKYV